MQKGSALSRLQYASSGTYIKYLGTVDINATSNKLQQVPTCSGWCNFVLEAISIPPSFGEAGASERFKALWSTKTHYSIEIRSCAMGILQSP